MHQHSFAKEEGTRPLFLDSPCSPAFQARSLKLQMARHQQVGERGCSRPFMPPALAEEIGLLAG